MKLPKPSCPCCGQLISEKYPRLRELLAGRAYAGVKLTVAERRTLQAVVMRAPTPERLAYLIYMDDPNGGADDAAGTVKVLVHRLRAKLGRGTIRQDANSGPVYADLPLLEARLAARGRLVEEEHAGQARMAILTCLHAVDGKRLHPKQL